MTMMIGFDKAVEEQLAGHFNGAMKLRGSSQRWEDLRPDIKDQVMSMLLNDMLLAEMQEGNVFEMYDDGCMLDI